jgi:hypothetical protein
MNKQIIKWVLIVAALILVLLLIRSCSETIKATFGKRPSDTTSVKEVIKWREGKDSIVYVPMPFEKIVYNDTGSIKYRTDSFETFEPLPADTAAILADYNAAYLYTDTRELKIGTQKYGSITIDDTVSRNRIVSRGFTTRLNIPEKTVTITVKEPPRTEWYFGINAAGYKGNMYGGASLLVKTKRDTQLEGGVLYGNDGTLLIQGGLKLKIRLKRR